MLAPATVTQRGVSPGLNSSTSSVSDEMWKILSPRVCIAPDEAYGRSLEESYSCQVLLGMSKIRTLQMI